MTYICMTCHDLFLMMPERKGLCKRRWLAPVWPRARVSGLGALAKGTVLVAEGKVFLEASWNLLPTSRDAKAGWMDGQHLCLSATCGLVR